MYTLAYAVDNNGDLWGWGMQTPTGVPLTTILPPARISGTCQGKSVLGGQWMNSFELCADGSVWQLDATRRRYLSKVAPLTGVTSMSEAAGGSATQALQADGTVWRVNSVGAWAAVPGLTGITAIGSDWQYSYAVATG